MFTYTLIYRFSYSVSNIRHQKTGMTCWVTNSVLCWLRATTSIRSKWPITGDTLASVCVCVCVFTWSWPTARCTSQTSEEQQERASSVTVYSCQSNTTGEACLPFFFFFFLQPVSQQELMLYTGWWLRRVRPLSPSLIMSVFLTHLSCVCAADRNSYILLKLHTHSHSHTHTHTHTRAHTHSAVT